MQAMDNEKRKHKRIEVTHPLNVIDTLSQESLGLVVNISADGMMLIGDKAIVEGAVYQAVISLDADGSQLNIGVECLWVSKADSEDKNWSGYRVIDVSERDQATLNLLLESL